MEISLIYQMVIQFFKELARDCWAKGHIAALERRTFNAEHRMREDYSILDVLYAL